MRCGAVRCGVVWRDGTQRAARMRPSAASRLATSQHTLPASLHGSSSSSALSESDTWPSIHLDPEGEGVRVQPPLSASLADPCWWGVICEAEERATER